MASVMEPKKRNVLVPMDPELVRLLRLERAETRKPVSRIIEGLVREYYMQKGLHRSDDEA